MPTAQRLALADRIRLIPAGAPAIVEDNAGLLRPGALDPVRMPVLLIEGGSSPPVIAAIQSGLAGRLPQARRAVVVGAGHMLPITHPHQVAEEIRRFLT
jgi:pimeloyl-ACP methyl ester carboxylesterase